MSSLVSISNYLKDHYWPLIKGRQTFLLTLTGTAGYLCLLPSPLDWSRFSSLVGSLLLTISGCSVLNMLFDRDIDRQMRRTSQRPLAIGQANSRTAAYLGAILITLGLLWSATLSMLYFVVVLVGAALNVLVYTLWLKRRTAWSILWGGVAGGMPILAGRALAIGHIDALGLVLGFIILCWIPSHNLTLTTLYSTDYLNAGVPTFLNVYGLAVTRVVVILSTLVTVLLITATFVWLNSPIMVMVLLVAISLGLAGIALCVWLKPSQKLITVLYKYSSLYMLISMLLLALNRLK